jgi:predicted fused transcriptional regulator/phosphomethylpyrimidine kinase
MSPGKKGPVMSAILKEKVSLELMEAAGQIIAGIAPQLTPDGEMEIVYALYGARAPDDVGSCVFSPGQNKTEGSSPSVKYNYSSLMVSGVLTAMRFSPDIRCACTVRYSEELKLVADDMLLEICTCPAGKAPPGITTMDWAVAFCSEMGSGVPDLLIIETDGLAPVHARLFGENPGSVATNLIKISQRIIDATH